MRSVSQQKMNMSLVSDHLYHLSFSVKDNICLSHWSIFVWTDNYVQKKRKFVVLISYVLQAVVVPVCKE